MKYFLVDEPNPFLFGLNLDFNMKQYLEPIIGNDLNNLGGSFNC